MRPAPIQWPNDAKIAVSFFVAFEAFDKSSQYRRSEGDKPDYASLAYGEYGGKAGIWRIMDSLNRNGVKGTIDTNGRIAEDFPDALQELHAAGPRDRRPRVGQRHSAHFLGCRQAGKSTHQTNFGRAGLRHRQATRSAGSVPGIESTNITFEHFVDEGIYWTGDLPGPDIPQHRMVNGKPLVIMPRLDYANDLLIDLQREKSRAGLFRKLQNRLRLSLCRRTKPGRPSSSIVWSTPTSAAEAQHHRRVRGMYSLRQELQ
jgi:allantoinase